MNQIVLMGSDLRDMYFNKGMRMKDIASHNGVSVGKVHKLFKQYGIIPRTRKECFSTNGYVMSAEDRKTVSERHKGKILSSETKQKISAAHKKGGIGSKKNRPDGYVYVYFPDHPKSTSDGYIMEHILVMECLIGRHLNPDEVVHHKNKKRNDNRKENLQLMTSREHMSMHMKERHVAERSESL